MGTTKYLISTLLIAVAFAISSNASAEYVGERIAAVEGKVSSKVDCQDTYCMQFNNAGDDVDIGTMFEDMEASPYASSLVDFWTTPACHAPQKNTIQVPIMFNSAIDPTQKETFPRAVHDYFIEEKHDPKAWLEIMHARSTDGSTILDFFQYNLDRGYYSIQAPKDAALRIVKYLCQNGGVYSKYKDTAKCPSDTQSNVPATSSSNRGAGGVPGNQATRDFTEKQKAQMERELSGGR
jgi:hypothetical protein